MKEIAPMAKRTCAKCGKTMREDVFYLHRNGQRSNLCKTCQTLHVDNFDPNTFLWLLKELDFPYVETEWNKIRDKAYAKNPLKMSGTSVIGRYLSIMKLNQWKPYGWDDNEKIAAIQAGQVVVDNNATRTKQQMQDYIKELKEKLEAGEITEAEYRTRVPADIQHQDDIIALEAPLKGMVTPMNYLQNPGALGGGYDDYIKSAPSPFDAVRGDGSNPFVQSNFLPESEIPDPAADLTREDMIYLATKWGRDFSPAQWVSLEQKYEEMMASFDIQDSDTIGSLILICKTYLKMNEAINIGDLDGFQKLSRVYDALRKSAKFTAVQKKQEGHQFIDSIGQLVSYCQKQGGRIPRYEITVDYDIADKCLSDMKSYTRSLIYEDPALAHEIEDYIKRRDQAEQSRRDRLEAEARGQDQVEITDDDMAVHLALVEREKKQDEAETYGEQSDLG